MALVDKGQFLISEGAILWSGNVRFDTVDNGIQMTESGTGFAFFMPADQTVAYSGLIISGANRADIVWDPDAAAQGMWCEVSGSRVGFFQMTGSQDHPDVGGRTADDVETLTFTDGMQAVVFHNNSNSFTGLRVVNVDGTTRGGCQVP